MDLFDLDFRVIRGVCVLLLLHPIPRWPDHPIKKQRPELAFRAFDFRACSSAYLRKRAIRPVKNEPKPSRLSSGRMEAVCGSPFALPCP